jgi:hypothetical protein
VWRDEEKERSDVGDHGDIGCLTMTS